MANIKPVHFMLPPFLPPLLFCTALLLSTLVAAQDRLAALAGDGSVLLRSPKGETLVNLNPDAALIPASLVKIPLSQVALNVLGEDFRFETHFYINGDGDLLVRGLGDPLLVSEELALIADNLASRGLQQVRRLIMDDTAFEADPDLPLETGTDQPYGARNGALAVNFNTVSLAWSEDGQLISGESQTPLTPLARRLGSRLSADGPPGETQRINLGGDALAGLQQAQQLLHLFLEDAGVTVSDTQFYREALNDQWTLYYAHGSSSSLRAILDGLLRYSNNFIANQVFLTLGVESGGYPATTAAARSVLQQQLAELYGEGFGSDPRRLLMSEGSGLSRAQRTSGAGMLRILESFSPFAELLPETGGVLRKSGTLTGVYNFAGYIRGQGGLYPFVILTNQSANNRARILQILQANVQ